MEIQINYEYRPEDIQTLFDIENLVELVLNEENVPPTCEVALTFVDEDTIHQLNAEYRGVDKPTDVLSFECDGLSDDFAHALETVVVGDNELPFELGDVVISVDCAQSQAPEYGLTFAEEVSLLITHGLLHLCGYDHMEDTEAAQMEARETELLSKFWSKPFKRCAVD